MRGEAGATVSCSGRSTRAQPNTTGYFAGRPETADVDGNRPHLGQSPFGPGKTAFRWTITRAPAPTKRRARSAKGGKR
jgi:hypothetical protein